MIFGFRMREILWAVLYSGAVATAASAYAPDTSLRPQPRSTGGEIVIATAGAQLTLPAFERPRSRPSSRPQSKTIALQQVALMTAPSGLAVSKSLRPNVRPKRLARKILASTPKPANTGRRGRVCGVNEIKGKILSSIPGKIRGCGVAKPVRVTEVSGVKLSQGAVMDCTTAKALNIWVRKGVFPAVGRLGGGPSSLRVVAHYACRTRNNKPGAKISEHGRGRAIDIAGVRLKSGAEISVLKGWRDPVQGKVLKSMHKAACGPFGTVLGPNADRYHKDHLHFDTARYRSGSYCR